MQNREFSRNSAGFFVQNFFQKTSTRGQNLLTFCRACGIIYIQGKGESENANRVAVRETHQKPFTKFVQVDYLTNSKKYDIIYTERKERARKAPKG